jgi:hypothetical protein
LIVTTPFALETDVDDGADGRVDVVDVATGATVDVVDGLVPSVGWLEAEHEVANATKTTTRAPKRERLLLRSR